MPVIEIEELPQVKEIILECQEKIKSLTGIDYKVKLIQTFTDKRLLKSEIMKVVSEYYDCAWSSIMGKSKILKLSNARKAYMYLATVYLEQPQLETARDLGKDSHSNVSIAVSKVHDYIYRNHSFSKDIKDILNRISLS